MPLFRRISLLTAPTPPALLLPRNPAPPDTPSPTEDPSTPTKTPPTHPEYIPVEIKVHIQTTLPTSASLDTVIDLLPRTARFTGVVSPVLLTLATSATDKSTGRSLLHWAAATGHNVLVSHLAALGADINTSDRNGNTALHTTILHGLTAGVVTLLSHGAETGIRNDKGWTALHLAAITGNHAIVDQLLSHGADVNIRCGSHLQTTPLHYGVMLSNLSVVQTLVARGADLTARDDRGMTPAQCAVAVGREGIVALVLRGKQRPVVSDLYGVMLGTSGVRSSLEWMFVMDRRDRGFDCAVIA